MPSDHFFHHGRFYAALLVGACAYMLALVLVSPIVMPVAGDAFFLSYLAACALILFRHTTEDLKRRAAHEDEGAAIVVAIAVAIIGLNLADIFLALNFGARLGAPALAAVLATAPLGWAVLHTIFAFRYANMYYADPPDDAARRGALEFPGTESPDLWDFLYFSFVIGMTSQVSDVQIRARTMRRVVTGHSIVSFFFNTVLIGLVVNAVASGH